MPKKNVLQTRKDELRDLYVANREEYVRQFRLCRALRHLGYPPGTLVYAKLVGFCPWPGVLWQLGMCPCSMQKRLFECYIEGHVLVRTFGDSKVHWYKVSPSLIELID